MIRHGLLAIALLCGSGIALAQTPAAPPPQWHGHHPSRASAEWRQKMEQRRMDRLALLLDLTASQRQQVQTIFSDEHARMKSAMQQVQQAMAHARATHQAVRKDTMQRLSSVLSPTQMRKFKALMPGPGMMHGMMMHRMMMHGMMMHDMKMHGAGHGMGGSGPGPGSQ